MATTVLRKARAEGGARPAVAPDGRDPLRAYAGKRDFARTPEPAGPGPKRRTTRLRFVVQKHAARRLHYDFRLELDGVLKSWAVTRGPSLVAGDKRLAVQTEDHPLSYHGFEGVIPAGQYGGGSVIIWDRGTWAAEGDAADALAAGKLTFSLRGERLRGRWHLVRTRPRGGKQQWLLLKADDAEARGPGSPDVLDECTTSVLSGRTNAELQAGGVLRADHAAREAMAKTKPRRAAPKGAKAALLPVFVEPCLATLVEAAPSADGWLHEVKFDGYRLQARLDGRDVELLTRTGLDWTDRFAAVADALRGLGVPSALIDGEVVVEDAAGLSSFGALQAALKAGRSDTMAFYAFDLLYHDGRDLRPLPLRDRKAALADLLAAAPAGGPLRLSEPFDADGPTVARHACRLGMEGIVSKRADRPYRSGRGDDWLKTKCTARQELVVAGYAPSTVVRRAVGSLVLGVYDEAGALRHVGRAGTGYTDAVARELWDALQPHRRADPPFAEALPPESKRGAVAWVEPVLVAEVELRGWTADGQVRHAAFKGVREDKPAADVRRETGAALSKRTRRAEAALPAVHLTHPDRVLWPDVGLTKEGLAAYYAAVAPWILPHVADRPLSLLRGPDGTGGKLFFQKHAWAGLDEAVVRRLALAGEDALAISDGDGLLALVQAGVLEIHPWGARAADPDRPDRLVFDLDPGEGVPWADTVAGAVAVRERLAALGHACFLKTSGGKGLHVVVPLVPRASWAEAKAFAKGIATAMARDEPGRFTAVATKSARTGRIYVDYLRNGRGATAVAPYSTRARTGAPVSVPITWDEAVGLPSGACFTVETAVRRLDHARVDPWARLGEGARPVERAPRTLLWLTKPMTMSAAIDRRDI